MFPNYVFNKTKIPTSRVESTFCYAGRKNLDGALKISPKMKQIVLLLFLLAAPAAGGRIVSVWDNAAEAKQAAGHQPKEVRVFFSEDRTDKPCAWLQ
jgi:hypothetical protein